jgi:hypothetical protein
VIHGDIIGFQEASGRWRSGIFYPANPTAFYSRPASLAKLSVKVSAILNSIGQFHR